jgi:hypothetical protein
LRRDELATLERLSGVVRRRVEAGAEPPYETTLAEAEHGATAVAVAEAEGERAHAWAELAALAEVPASTAPPAGPPEAGPVLASPGEGSEGTAPSDPAALRERLDSGALASAARARAVSAEALARLSAARDDSRWSLASALAREADESVARIGVAYRFARSGERAAITRTTETAAAAARREAEIAIAGLAARLYAALALDRAIAASPAPAPVEPALTALELRLTEGKSPPSEVLLLRRQLLAAREAALDRELARLSAVNEIRLLTTEVKP